jgi:hypothetical protein
VKPCYIFQNFNASCRQNPLCQRRCSTTYPILTLFSRNAPPLRLFRRQWKTSFSVKMWKWTLSERHLNISAFKCCILCVSQWNSSALFYCLMLN